ncbi:acVLRF1 family peptidyl-tRNA hydrolase [Arthrobacter psychrolactophilus]
MNLARRTAFVPAARLSAWLSRFTAAHGGQLALEDTDDGVSLRLRDGAVALLSPPWPDDGRPGRGANLLERIESLAAQERRLGIILVRRGGYGVGIAVGGKLVAHKVGTASSRSRGGDQAAAIVERAAAEAAKIFAGASFEYVAPGGDKQLIEAVLSASPLRIIASRPRLAALAVVDPKMAVLEKAAADFCSVRIQITEPPA